jgi:hypothetical protein
MYDDALRVFFIGGELRSKFDVMPLETVWLEYQIIPLQLGHYDLPKLHLLDRSVNQDVLKLQARKFTDPVEMAKIEKTMKVDFLVKSFTQKVYVN